MMERAMGLQPILLSRINICTGSEIDGLTAVDFTFQCALPSDASISELAQWISAYFERRDQ
jgi:hypothetical protein